MAHYDIFREQLAMKYPAFGHALWEPEPRNPDRPVQVGDVGIIREGKFQRLFNALLPADDPSHEFGVPEYHEPLVPSLLNHIDRGSRSSNNYCSAGVSVGADPGYYSFGPDDFRQVSFQYSGTRGAAVLSLPAVTRRENTLAQGEFGRWMVRHIDSWLAFARKLGLGIEEMEEIILVTGRDLTKSWTNIAFLGGQADAQVSFGVKVKGPSPDNINYQLLPELVRGAVISQGPEGTNLPESQCVFIRGFRVARPFWLLPKHLKAAAGPSPDPGGYDCDPDMELVSIPAVPMYRDPLRLLQDYIAGQASDCDAVLVHDNDLLAINGIGHGTSLETLNPDVMMDLLGGSNIEIHKVSCDSPPTNGLSGPNTDVASVKVAMISLTFQNWNTASPPQWSTLASQNIDLDHTNESRGTPPAVPGNLQVSTIVQNALGESHPTYSQVAVSSCSHSGMPVGYDAVIDTSQALQQPPTGRSTRSELYLVRSANETNSPASDYSRVSQFGPSPYYPSSSFPVRVFSEPNAPGPLRGVYFTSNYYYGDAPQGGTTYPTHGSVTFSHFHVFESRLVTMLGHESPHDTSQALQRLPVAQSTRTVYIPSYWVDEPQPYLPRIRQQSLPWSPSQGTGVRNAMRESYSQSANEPRSSYPLGFIHPQNPGPMTPAWSPSQCPAGVQNTLAGPYSQGAGHTMIIKKRKAVIIGIDYSQHPNPRFRLRHCTEDAYAMANFFCDNYGSKRDDIHVMTDKTPWDLPTKDNILGAMRTLVYDAQPGDSIVFYSYCLVSGHGLQIKDADANGDELNGLDECICAIDYRGDDPYLNHNTPGLIVDNVMHELMVKPLPRLTAIFDSRHSEAPLCSFLIFVYVLDDTPAPNKHPRILHQTTSYADVVSLSTGTSKDEGFETDRGGALRCAFIESVRTFGDTLTYKELLWSIRDYMKRQGFLLRPQLSTSHEIVCPRTPSEPGGVVPFIVTAGHPTLSGSVFSTVLGVTVLHSPPIFPAQNTQYMPDDEGSGMSIWQRTGSGVYRQVPAAGSVLDLYKVPQSSSPTAVQTKPHFNSIDIHVPGAQGLSQSPHSSGVGQQQRMPHDNTMLYFNGVCAPARAPATEAVRNPMLSAWPKNLHLEFVATPNIPTLDIQASMHDAEAAVLRIDGTDSNMSSPCKTSGSIQGNHSHQIHLEFVGYRDGSVPYFYVVGEHDGARMIPPLVTLSGNSLDEDVFRGCISGIKMIKDFRERDPNGFSYHLSPITVGQRDDAEYPSECPDFLSSHTSWHPNWNNVRDELKNVNVKLSRILVNPHPEFQQPFFEILCMCPTPRLYASPYDTILLSGFRPASELGESPTNSLVHGIQYITNDQSLGAPTLQYMQVPATDPVHDPNEGLQVPGAPGLDGMLSSGGGVEQSMLHYHWEELVWTGTLCLNGVRVHARAPAPKAVRNPKLRAWPKYLQLETVADPIPTLDIQAWILEKKVPVVRVGSIDGTDNWNFNHLVGAIRNGGGYAIVKWENRGVTLDRLLLVPVGDIPERPKRQEPRPIRVLKPSKRFQGKGKSRAGPSVTMPTSIEGLCGEAAQSTTIPPKLQSVPEGAYCAQDVEEPIQGDSNTSSSLYQEDAQHQEMSSDEMDVDEELDDGQMDAGCVSDSSDI